VAEQRILIARVLWCASLALLLAACARPDAAWEEARRLDTPDGYASYQERHPRSPHAAEARTRREALLAERDWSVARNLDTSEGYREYLEKHPEGLWAGKAKERVNALSLETSPVTAAPVEAVPVEAAPVEAAPVEAAPAPIIPAATAPAKTPPSPPAPKIYVQLGAFSSAEGAQKAWRELQSRHAALRELQPVYRRSGKGDTGLHLLRAGVATRADAEKLCRTLQAAGQACLIS
jgi:cell division septation protein DedD